MHSLRFVSLRAVVVPAVLLVAAACRAPSDEPTSAVEQRQISDTASMVQRPDGTFDATCKNGTHEVVTAAQIAQNQVCGSTGLPGGVVIYDPSDSCATSDALARVTASTDCNALSTARASSVSVNGQCIDIVPDSTIRQACLTYQPGRISIFDPSDSCSPSNVVGSFNADTDCNTLGSARASSILVDGRCVDLVPDSTLRNACLAYQPNHLVIFDPSDSCSPDNIVASVGVATDCGTLSSARASSILIDGRCTDLVPDSTIRQACIAYHP